MLYRMRYLLINLYMEPSWRRHGGSKLFPSQSYPRGVSTRKVHMCKCKCEAKGSGKQLWSTFDGMASSFSLQDADYLKVSSSNTSNHNLVNISNHFRTRHENCHNCKPHVEWEGYLPREPCYNFTPRTSIQGTLWLIKIHEFKEDAADLVNETLEHQGQVRLILYLQSDRR
jgi:hypothetical protein